MQTKIAIEYTDRTVMRLVDDWDPATDAPVVILEIYKTVTADDAFDAIGDSVKIEMDYNQAALVAARLMKWVKANA